MNWKAIRTVLGKELRETLRDRRTMILMIVVPVLLYPGMFVAMEQIALVGQRSLRAESARVAIVHAPARATGHLAQDPEIVLEDVSGSPHEALRQGRVDVVLTFAETWTDTATNAIELLYDGTRDRSAHARGIVDRRLGEWLDTLRLERLRSYGLPAEFATPLRIEQTSVATPAAVGGYMLGRFLPLLLIMMTVLGAFYPSIDLAAGEKERGTLEPLLMVPVHADNLVIGKFAAAALMGLTAATLNLGSMLLTFQAGIVQFATLTDATFHLPLHAVLVILAVLTLLAILFSALFLGIAVRSQSFKEAQNALTPIYMLGLLPALLPLIPGMDFGHGMALVPVAGIAFLFRDLMSGDAAFGPTLTAIAATIFYTALALRFAARSFGREEVLFGPGGADGSARRGRAGWRRLWRGATRRTVPAPASALALVAVVALLFFYGARPLVFNYGEKGLALAQVLLLALPALLLVVVGRYDARRTFALEKPQARSIVGALAIILGGIPLSWLIAWLQGFVLAVPVEFLEAMQELVVAEDARSMIGVLLVLALTPAICEELVFRGVLLQALGTRLTGVATVVLSAVVFGAFHLSSVTVIRLLPTIWLGLLLGMVVWRTRSIFPAMLMHLVNNALVVAIVSTPVLRELFAEGGGQPPWLLVGIAPFLLLAGWFVLPGRHGPEDEQRSAPATASESPVMLSG